MLEPAAALAALLADVVPSGRTERLPLAQALGGTLATPLIATLANPPFDASAMDGYALALSAPATAGTCFDVTHTAAAGALAAAVAAGSAARIFTGAPLPVGANTVVIQENVRRHDNTIELLEAQLPGANVRRAGEDFQPATELLAAGTALGAAQLGLAAASGAVELEVIAPLRIVLISTGDELRAPGAALAAGQIVNSNAVQLSALLAAQGCAVDAMHVPDDLAALQAALDEAADRADLIITTGGASVGERDYLKAALAGSGTLQLYKVAMKPGKPLVFGRVGAARTALLGLPGNPVSAFVTFALFGKPLIDALRGRPAQWPQPQPLPANFAVSSGSRTEFLRVRRGRAGLELLQGQGSHQLTALALASGLAMVSPHLEIRHGDLIPYLSFAELLGSAG